MTKKTVLISIFVLLVAFLLVVIVNNFMGKSNIFTNKNKTDDKAKGNIQTSTDANNVQNDYSYVSLDDVLRIGAEGDEVKRVQYILKQKGFYNGDITGSFDSSLKKAVTEFQKSCNLQQTGIVNVDTINALLSIKEVTEAPEDTQASDTNQQSGSSSESYKNVEFTRDIYPGMTGDDVKKAQYLLKEKGYYKGEITGNYDDDTKNAVIAFQKDNNIRQTGNVGEMTKTALTK